ncbi:MAG: hypothetical protein LQ338_006373 [Usnochroma carphineum]|nr:MAG: hypothetical protein LQ338_006373 [Usnochroma carphineum]
MHYLPSVSTSLLLSLLAALTHAVDIQIAPAPFNDPNGPPGHPFITQRCPGIPPGVCCIPRPSPANAVAHPDKEIKVTGLETLDVVAAWTPHNGKSACDGKVQASHWGAGQWIYNVPADEPDVIISGASWLKIPTGDPGETDVPWMQGEGVLGFMTGRGDWFSQDVNKARASNLAASLGFGSMAGKGFPWAPQKVKRFGKRVVDLGRMGMGPRGLEKREIRSAEKGWVLCRSPRRGVYPDVIEVDGVEYKAEQPQGPVYISDGGKVLNYTEAAG